MVETGGVGYLIYVPNGQAFLSGEEVSLWTHLAVRENALDLYGFVTRSELDLFEQLLTLPKIGPKSALGVMSQAQLEVIEQAVRENDPTYLAKMSGLGRKTAEKVVAGLQDHLDKFSKVGSVGEGEASPAPPRAPYASDAIDALVALGYSPGEARAAVQKLPPETKTATEAVRFALQLLNQDHR